MGTHLVALCATLDAERGNEKMSKLPYIFLLLLTAMAAIGPSVAPFDPFHYDLRLEMLQPSTHHWFGTDENGRDLLSRILYGARISLGIGVAVVTICLSLGMIIGFLAAYFGGWFEKAFLAVSDVFQAFPGILLAICVAAFLPPSVLNIILLLSFVGWVSYARVTRAQVLTVKHREYVQAAQSLGVPIWRIFLHHVLPNIAGPLMVQAAFGMAGVILIESTLSFLGLGIPVTVPSWGRMLDSGSSLLLVAPHISIFPGLAIMFAVLTFNLLGDQLRDRFSGEK